MNMRHGHKLLDIAKDAQGNKKVEKYLKEEDHSSDQSISKLNKGKQHV
jgi:hypothetical protein